MESPLTKTEQIFVSHAIEDAQFAHRLADDLQRLGVRVWIAPDSIRPGEGWVEAIERGLKESNHMVVVLTPAALESEWVRKETDVAIAQERKGRIQVIPLDVEPCEVPLLLSSYQMVSFRRDYDAGLSQLANILGLRVVEPPDEIRKLEEEERQKPAKGVVELLQKVMAQPGISRYLIAAVVVVTFVVVVLLAGSTSFPQLLPTATATPAATVTSKPEPLTSTATPTPTSTPTPMPTATATDTPVLLATPTSIALVEVTPTQTPVEATPTPTPQTDCTEGPKSPECYEVDIYTKDGTVLTNVELTCGPKGGMVLTSDATIRFTKKLEDIRGGIFPERCLRFSCISRIDFLEMNENESNAVASYGENGSDFFERQWHKVKMTFYDGETWDNVYVYDKCSFKSMYEAGPLDALDPTTIIIRLKENCK